MRSTRSLLLSGLQGTSATRRDRSADLLLAGAWCAAVAGVLAAIFAWRLESPALGIVALSQVVVIALVFIARRIISGRFTELQTLANVDPATGCLNRRGFAHALDEALVRAANRQHELAMLALDLDHFKQINDRYGHNIGDAVLYEVAAVIVEEVGTDGVVARMGGEEFSVLLPTADAESAGVIAERLLARVRTHRLTSVASTAVVTMSVGIAAERVQSMRDGAALRARADEALYKAKHEGRDRVLLWAPGVHSHGTPAAAAVPIIRTARWSANNMHT